MTAFIIFLVLAFVTVIILVGMNKPESDTRFVLAILLMVLALCAGVFFAGIINNDTLKKNAVKYYIQHPEMYNVEYRATILPDSTIVYTDTVISLKNHPQ